jgi:glycerophosphoryl diester phosphodiesterase
MGASEYFHLGGRLTEAVSPSALFGTTNFRRRDGAPPYVYGHRGARREAPENTMAAFELAAGAGAHGIELDVRLCQSGQVVVCHDPTLSRTTQGRDDRSIADLAYAELERVDLGSGARVPLLEDVLAWAKGRLRVNVEVKRDVPDRARLVRETALLLRGQGPALSNVIVSSFDPWMLAYLGWLLPEVLRGYLFGSDQKPRASVWVAALIRADAVHPESTLLSVETCRRYKERFDLINAWTVNDPAQARALAAMGVDSIVTDVPRVILAALP